MHLPDRSPGALKNLRSSEDRLLARVRAVVGKASDPTYVVLREELESRQALRVCRTESWNLSHMLGWQIEFPALASTLPAATPAERARVLRLWKTLPQYLSTDIDNLRAGVAQGYIAPKAVVRRVLRQIDALLAMPTERSPFYAPAVHAGDREFAAALSEEIARQVTPAIRGYADFLRNEYLPRARESLGLSALKNGAACYAALLRRYTTTDDTPEFVFETGERMVDQSTREIQQIGERLYGTADLAAIIARSRSDPRNRFGSAEQLLDFSSETLKRAERRSRDLFLHLPAQPVVVEPIPAYQEGSGVTSSYAANPDPRQPATFRIALDQWSSETRGAAEITTVHETVPGHHLQIATARELQPSSVLSKLVSNSAYIEGWANYAERLAEESGIDDDDYERIQRRVLAGRSLVIDPGIHAFGWTRERAENFAMQTGMSRDQADDVIDRIAVEPAQLTSYEIGGLEILSLREKARKELAQKFDVRVFHQCVLENGPVPLMFLRTSVAGCMGLPAQSAVQDWCSGCVQPGKLVRYVLPSY